ncbi:Cytosolic sulfotransferase 5 [Linum perenne]
MSSSTELDAAEQEKQMFWDTTEIRKIQGFWHRSNLIGATNAFRANFQPSRDDVIILASSQKTGTTWLKALSHCILFRDDEEEDMLTKVNPHSCAPSFEIRVYAEDPSFRLTDIDQRRLFHTHLPYSHLPSSIKSHARNCKLIYIARDPKDTLISQWHFFNKILTPITLEDAAEIFCNGTYTFGPYWDHVLEYWGASQRSPEKVMFIKYEDLRRDPKPQVRKLASFLGKPFGGEEEDDVEVEKVIWRSSFDRLKGLDANKTGMIYPVLSPLLTSDLYFRRGEVGDWRNHLTPEMAKRIDDITRVKFRGCGLYLKDEGDVDSKPMI